MRVVAIVAAYNEERFIAQSLDHLERQGVQVYLIDNDSTDRTVEIASGYRGRNLIGLERFPRDGTYRWGEILRRKEVLAQELDADWFMHVDPDEAHVPPPPYRTLNDAFSAADAEGYTVVNFDEFTFMPVRESPDHDHPRFTETMRWYYPFAPIPLRLMRAWKKTASRVDLSSAGGHQIWFPEFNLYPSSFPMRHYLFLSPAHAVSKFVRRGYDPNSIEGRDWRARLTPELIQLPRAVEMRYAAPGDPLDSSNPRTIHYLQDVVTARLREEHGASSARSEED